MKTLNNHQVSKLKDLICSNATIYNRNKLKYMGDIQSKSGKTFHRLRMSSMAGHTTYFVADGVIHLHYMGKLIPLDVINKNRQNEVQ